MKRGGLLVIFTLCIGFSLGAQQITKFAVVDLPKVYTTFFRDSQAVREFEEQSARVQADINRMTAEIQTLQSSRLDAQGRGDQAQALQLENEIYRKSEYLRQYYEVKTAELNDQKSRLASSSSFLDQVYREIRYIAESEGYSMVLNKENPGIVWYSASVDITDMVIQRLQIRAGRR
jgi:outer membrane protein